MKHYTLKNLMYLLQHFNAELSPENQKLFFAQLSRVKDLNGLDYSLHFNRFTSTLFIELYEYDNPLAIEGEPSEIIAYLNHEDAPFYDDLMERGEFNPYKFLQVED